MKYSWIKIAGLIWALLVVCLALTALSRPANFDSSIMSLLPESKQQPLAQQAIEQTTARFSKRLLILVSGENESVIKTELETLAAEFAALEPVAEVRWRIQGNQLQTFYNEMFPYRFALLDEQSRNKLIAENYQTFEKRALANLFSPVSAGKIELVDDPFGFYTQLSQRQATDINVQISEAFLKVKNADTPTYLMLITLNEEPYSLAVQKIIIAALSDQKERLKKLNLTVRSSGMILHAAAGAEQAKSEISSIGIGSFVGIIVMLLIVFRRIKPLALILLPVTIGCITAVAVTLLIFGQVHLITLAFGAGLVGVSIDYALHYVCERQQTSAVSVLAKIFPGLILGLLSSVLAYAVQAFAPFPGLQQMALFSVVGLVASWLTVVLIYPLLTRNDANRTLPLAQSLFRLRNKIPAFRFRALSGVLLIALGATAIITILNGTSQDDIRLLQTSPDSLLQQERSIQTLLGTSSSTQFILVKCDNLEACLNKEQRLFPNLTELRNLNIIPDFQALSSHLPSNSRQGENYQLVQQLYDAKLADLYGKLKLDSVKLQSSLDAFSDAKNNLLSSHTWLSMQSSEAWRDLLVSQEINNSATIIRFSGHLNNEAKAAIGNLLSEDSDLVFIDQVSNISDLMKNYRMQVSQLIFLAYAIVFVILFWRYRLQVWRVILPPLMASLITLASITLINGGMNMFHLLALILVLGIGLDMGIFMTESAESQYTWLAVSMSTFTSLLAFGLLAWSQTPVLHHFGLTVLIGLSLVWVLTPMMRKTI